MIYSMTGYSRVTRNINGSEHTVEIKTLNHKYIDIKLSLPRDIEHLEYSIGETLRSRLQRGSIKLSYNIKKTNSGTINKKNKFFEINLDAAEAYNEAFARTAKKLKIKYEPFLETIIKQPGVLSVAETDSEADKDSITSLINEAIDALNKFRSAEGHKLSKIISARLKSLGLLLNKISGYRKNVQKVYFDRLKDRIDNFLKNAKIDIEISEERLSQEIVLLADKSDITEEIDRFLTHIKHFESLLKDKDKNKETAAGRKMDFL